MTTVYEHNGKTLFTDEKDEYDPEAIRVHYTAFDKSLLSATYTVIPPEKEGDPRKIVFAKKTGTKGVDHPVVAAILAAPPALLAAVALLEQIEAMEDPGQAPQLIDKKEGREAVEAAEKIAEQSFKVVLGCLSLRPIPLPRPPSGF